MTGRKTNRTKIKNWEHLNQQIKITASWQSQGMSRNEWQNTMSDWRSISAWDTVRFIFIRLCGITVMWPPSMFWYLGAWIWVSDLPNLWASRRIIHWAARTHLNLPLGELFLFLPALKRLKINIDQWRPDLPVVERLHHKERAVYHPSITPWLRNWKGLRFSTCDLAMPSLWEKNQGMHGLLRVTAGLQPKGLKMFQEVFLKHFSQQRAKVLAPKS